MKLSDRSEDLNNKLQDLKKEAQNTSRDLIKSRADELFEALNAGAISLNNTGLTFGNITTSTSNTGLPINFNLNSNTGTYTGSTLPLYHQPSTSMQTPVNDQASIDKRLEKLELMCLLLLQMVDSIEKAVKLPSESTE